LEFLVNHCSASFTQYNNLLITLFLAGLVGGFTHCAGMCGPFVSSQVVNKFDSLPIEDANILQRLKGSALIPYHLGRMTTYVILGVIAAILSRQIIGSPIERWVAVVLLTIAGGVFIASAMPYFKGALKIFRGNIIIKLAEKIGRIAKPLMSNPTGLKGYGLGVMLGFIPCGLIFAALMVVATTSDPISAAMGMILFTIGTIPSLLLVGFGSQFAFRRWPQTIRKFASIVMLFNGFSLFYMAGNIIF